MPNRWKQNDRVGRKVFVFHLLMQHSAFLRLASCLAVDQTPPAMVTKYLDLDLAVVCAVRQLSAHTGTRDFEFRGTLQEKEKKNEKFDTGARVSLLSWIIFFQVASRLTDGLSHNCCSQLQFFSSGTLSYDVSIWVLWGDMGRGPRCRMSFRSLEKETRFFLPFSFLSSFPGSALSASIMTQSHALGCGLDFQARTTK